jgi:hypothetical protein
MTPELLLKLVVRPVVAHLAWPQPRERELLLVAIAIQESALKHRRQQPSGPARSYFQIESPTAYDCCTRCIPARRFLQELGVKTMMISPESLEHNDLAACAIAAGILRLHPGRLPELGDHDGAWQYYLASWRPGSPRPASWPASYREAWMALRS